MRVGFIVRLRQINEQAAAGQQGYVVLLREFTRRVFQAEVAHLLWRRADKGDAVFLAGLGEGGVLTQKSVAGMNRLRTGRVRHVEDLLLIEIALCRRRRTDAHGLVGLPHMQGMPIGLGIHSNRLDAEPLEGADDAAGDGAAIGNQNFVEHERCTAGRPALCWAAAGRPAGPM